MKNFKIKVKDQEYWISRSIAVAAFIFTKDENGNFYILANQRGKGTPDFQGYWNCPCGYLDYNETTVEAACREVQEETSVICPELEFFAINSDPNANKQNVTIQYWGFIEKPIYQNLAGGEENEVLNVKWINVKDVNSYDWAFNHDKVIQIIFNTLFI